MTDHPPVTPQATPPPDLHQLLAQPDTSPLAQSPHASLLLQSQLPQAAAMPLPLPQVCHPGVKGGGGGGDEEYLRVCMCAYVDA